MKITKEPEFPLIIELDGFLRYIGITKTFELQWHHDVRWYQIGWLVISL